MTLQQALRQSQLLLAESRRLRMRAEMGLREAQAEGGHQARGIVAKPVLVKRRALHAYSMAMTRASEMLRAGEAKVLVAN